MAESAAPFVECEQVHAGLAVNDIATAVEFYTKKLGFAAAFTWGDPPTFAGVKLDKAQMFLRKATPRPEGLLCLFHGWRCRRTVRISLLPGRRSCGTD
jgi:catechol 2,3-dioxygenase-like lactoylglutathione lyase family enzyme